MIGKIKIQYPTKERKYLSRHTYQNVHKTADLKPIKIIRHPCGTGAAASRYYYEAVFHAPIDAEFVYRDTIRANINRKANPKFKPSDFNFVNNVWMEKECLEP